MEAERMGFFARLWLALVLPWKVLFDSALARRVDGVCSGALALPPPAAMPDEERASSGKPPDAGAALHLLAVLQREGRLVDFLQEDIAGIPDVQIGAAARVVHEGCRKALVQYVTLEPLRKEPEGAAVVIEEGFNPSQVRLTGNVVGKPPFKGRLVHHGWRASEVKLAAPAAQDLAVVMPAEVEL